MEQIKRALGNAPVFVIAYVIFMLPTYFLPYFGSNSSFLHVVDAVGGGGYLNFAFWLHMGSMLILCFFCWVRGAYINKGWLIIFPIMAIVFDFVPILSSIPLVPTVMHLLAIILGVTGTANVMTAGAAPSTNLMRNGPQHSSTVTRTLNSANAGPTITQSSDTSSPEELPPPHAMEDARPLDEKTGNQPASASLSGLKPSSSRALPLTVVVAAVVIAFLANSLYGSRQEFERLRASVNEQTNIAQREGQARTIAEQQVQTEKQAKLAVEAQLAAVQKRTQQENEARRQAEAAVVDAQKKAREEAEARRQSESAEARQVAREQYVASKKASAEVDAKRNYEDRLASAEKRYEQAQQSAKEQYQRSSGNARKVSDMLRTRQNYEKDISRAKQNYEADKAKAEAFYGDAMTRAQKTYEQVSVAR
jgi:hypothetical protein